MLKEYKNVQQEAGSKGKRRWFSGSTLDLVVWYNEKGTLDGFQLCYDLASSPHAFTWRQNGEITHEKVDTGEGDPRKNLSPILISDGTPPLKRVLSEFTEKSSEIDQELAAFIIAKLSE